MTELTILMPCLNEAETIETCIRKAKGYLERSGISGEVVIADNGSTDGSQAMAEALGARVVDVPVKGLWSRSGRRDRRGARALRHHGRQRRQLRFLETRRLRRELRGGADLVMGNRFQGGIAPSAMPPLHRYLGNPVLSTIGRVFSFARRSVISIAACAGFPERRSSG
jgi:glycosyltransferase involved in cell wall biosynthesis